MAEYVLIVLIAIAGSVLASRAAPDAGERVAKWLDQRSGTGQP